MNVDNFSVKAIVYNMKVHEAFLIIKWEEFPVFKWPNYFNLVIDNQFQKLSRFPALLITVTSIILVLTSQQSEVNLQSSSACPRGYQIYVR